MAQIQSVLLVDDDRDIRAIAQICLEEVGGLSTSVAAGGREAIRAARSGLPDVILLDMTMPELDGLGTLELLLADPTTADIPVIFMTARVQARDLSRYIDAGAVGVIAKPFDPMTIADEVRAIVGERASTRS